MPSARELLLWVRANRPTYDVWRAAVEYLAHGVDDKTRTVNVSLIAEAVKIETDETPMLLFSSRSATRAALYALGYGEYRDRVAVKMVELRLTQ